MSGPTPCVAVGPEEARGQRMRAEAAEAEVERLTLRALWVEEVLGDPLLEGLAATVDFALAILAGEHDAPERWVMKGT